MKNFSRIAAHSALLATVLWIAVPFLSLPSDARELPDSFPRLANYFLKTPVTIAEARQLARWDMLVLGLELQYLSPEIFPILRELNPDIILLAYLPSEEIPLSQQALTDAQHPHYKLVQGVAESWWLHNAAGGRFGYWPGTQMMNVTNNAPVVNGHKWNTYAPTFAHNTVMSTGLWDGIFYDNVWPDISWMNGGDIDSDNNGAADAASSLDAAWRDGMSTMLGYSRSLEGNDAIIIGNGGGEYYTSMNGRLIEDFPAEEAGGWTGEMRRYVDVMQRGKSPAVVIVNGKSTTGQQSDYRALRFALASTLLDNGFLSFDFGTQRHADLWWYDEYSVSLGTPVTRRKNLLRPGDATITPGLWRRDFENGIVLLNSSTQSRTVELADAYEEVTGTQTASNNGELVTSVTIPPMDAKLLLRRELMIAEGQYANGAFVRQFSPDGTVTRQGFYTYDASYDGGADIIKRDLDGDGSIETITTQRNLVIVRNEANSPIAAFAPYGTRYKRAIHLAVGDLDGDNMLEIITGTGKGGGPHVRSFTRNGIPRGPGFFAYDKKFRGGVQIATGDLDGDGKDEIVTGAGFGGGPHVRIFSGSGKVLGGFFAYNKKFRGGVSVAVGNVAGDDKAEIVTGAGPGGGPHIRIFSNHGNAVLPGFFAFDPNFRGGVRITVQDVNNDLQDDILVATTTLY